MTPDRSKIDVEDGKQIKYWTRSMGISKADLLEAVAKVGNAAAAVRKELQVKGLSKRDDEEPLKPEGSGKDQNRLATAAFNEAART